MKAIILAGGLGSRLAEETGVRPKPLVEIGGRPILWHIMQIFHAAAFSEFVVALGYKGEMIKEFFLNYHALSCDLTLDLATGTRQLHGSSAPAWRIHLVDTGATTQTGGRVLRLREWVCNETFMLTYGDGLANINVRKLVEFHKSHGKLATVTLVRPPARFGAVECRDNLITRFVEKPQTGEGWISGGFFVLEPGIFAYLKDDTTIWERHSLEELAQDGQLMAYHHDGFFQPMDNIREKHMLEEMWQSGNPPWMNIT